jgi:repressor LexA
MKEMTGKQRDVYDFICHAIHLNGYPPTVREIGENFAISVKGAYDHLKAIERKGFIKCSSSKSRAIEVMNQFDRYSNDSSDMMRVPLLGQTQAGMPMLAEQNTEEEYYLPKSLLGDTELFALRVKGDSMVGAGIHDGDLALIRIQKHAENGEIVVALLDNEATIKRFYRDKNSIRLEPENDAYQPIISSSVDILGKVVWVFRRIM